MKGFIRAAEIWVPSLAGNDLVHYGGAYGSLTEFGAISREMRFAFDEGLPGKAWARRYPIMLADLQGSYFKRAVAAKAARLECGIALPVFDDTMLKAVIVFFCGKPDPHAGAIELWSESSPFAEQFSLADGYYGSAELTHWTPDGMTFKRGFDPRVVVWPTSYRRGEGLPGLVWHTDRCQIVNDPLATTSNLRADASPANRLELGLGLPWHSDPNRGWIMTLLSTATTPMLKRAEIWEPDSSAQELRLRSSSHPQDERLPPEIGKLLLDRESGLIGRAWARRSPELVETPSSPDANLKKALEAIGVEAALAIPVAGRDRALRSIVALYL